MKILVKEVRESKDVSIKELSTLSGITEYRLKKIEKGEGRIYIQDLLVIADALKVDIYDISTSPSGIRCCECPHYNKK